MIGNDPEYNFKVLIWVLIGLGIAGFLLLAGPGRADASSIVTNSIEVHELSYNADGYVIVRWEPFNDREFCWEWRNDKYEPWNSHGGNYFKFSDAYFFTEFIDPVDISYIAEQSQDPDFDRHYDAICKTYPAGETQVFYIQDDGPYFNDHEVTESEYLDEVLKMSDSEMAGIDSDTTLEVYSWLGGDEGDRFTGKPWIEPMIAGIDYPPDGAENRSWPEDFTISWENIPAEFNKVFLRVRNEYYDTGPISKTIGTASTTTSGTSTIKVPATETTELGIGPYHAFLWFEKADGTETKTFEGLDYRIEFGESFEVTLPLPEWEIATDTAENFYDSNSDYATPTPAFDVIFDSIEPFYGWIENISEMFKNRFSPDNAFDKGKEMGTAVATGRAYAGTLDEFFGLPISWALILYILLGTAIIVFRLIKGLVQLVKP